MGIKVYSYILSRERKIIMSAQADTQLKRLPERGSQDFELACSILDEARIIPMALGRDGKQLLLHGSVVSRLMTSLAEGLPCCVAVTHLDGLVLARSAFHSSMNYRSLMVFGTAKLIDEPGDKNRGLDVLVEHLVPGRLTDLRASTRKELNATTLLALPIESFSIKSRTGPPSDAAADISAPIWAGVIPLELTEGEPVTAPDMVQAIELPAYLRGARR
jgi:nitroimidazol reductase NimA-like FMN-containing flavoprotein (pyridoxamine 5'-phosphate oxidase superfamily)